MEEGIALEAVYCSTVVGRRILVRDGKAVLQVLARFEEGIGKQLQP